jgi:ABC-type Fe3+-citrate transport system substrate-binding protein
MRRVPAVLAIVAVLLSTVLVKGLADNIGSEANLQGTVIRRITPSEGQCTITVSAKRLVALRIENKNQVCPKD